MEEERHEDWITPEDLGEIFRLPPLLGRQIVANWFRDGMPCVKRGNGRRARMTKRSWAEEWLEKRARADDVPTEASIVKALFPALWSDLNGVIQMLRHRNLSITNIPPADEEAQDYASHLLWSSLSYSFEILEEETDNDVKKGWKEMQDHAERRYRSSD